MEYEREWFILNLLPKFFSSANDIQCTENNYSTLLYHFLLNAGVSHKQVCREMLTKFEGEESKYSLKRPDIAIFNKKINGRFNYTSKGIESNTPLKKECLRFIAEFKGSAWRGNNQALSDKGKKGKIVEDIEFNLPLWKKLFNKEADYFFFAINLDMPKGIWSSSDLSRFCLMAYENDVHLVYYMQGKKYFSYFDCSKPIVYDKNGHVKVQIIPLNKIA